MHIRSLLFILLLLVSCSGNPEPEPTSNPSPIYMSSVPAIDSTVVASQVAMKFYDWYLDGLHSSAMYRDVHPSYTFVDTIAVIESDPYLRALKQLGIVSDTFLESERLRFESCQIRLNELSYQRLDECGCSPDNLVDDCDFIDEYHWIASDEKYNGAELDSVSVSGDVGTVRLKFFYEIDSPEGKSFDARFRSTISLRKYDNTWLIDAIDPKEWTLLDLFEPIDWTNLHVFSPDGTSEDPMFKGRPIDSTFYHHFEINTYINQFFTGYYHIHASYRIELDGTHVGLIVRQMSQYNESSITLYVYDRQQSTIISYVELADSFGDGSWYFDENGWLIDLNGNGYPDLIKKKNEWWEEDDEDTNETTSHSSQTFTTFEFRDGTFIESGLEIDEDRFKVKGWKYEN